jgi:hypothetical protein
MLMFVSLVVSLSTTMVVASSFGSGGNVLIISFFEGSFDVLAAEPFLFWDEPPAEQGEDGDCSKDHAGL